MALVSASRLVTVLPGLGRASRLQHVAGVVDVVNAVDRRPLGRGGDPVDPCRDPLQRQARTQLSIHDGGLHPGGAHGGLGARRLPIGAQGDLRSDEPVRGLGGALGVRQGHRGVHVHGGQVDRLVAQAGGGRLQGAGERAAIHSPPRGAGDRLEGGAVLRQAHGGVDRGRTGLGVDAAPQILDGAPVDSGIHRDRAARHQRQGAVPPGSRARHGGVGGRGRVDDSPGLGQGDAGRMALAGDGHRHGEGLVAQKADNLVAAHSPDLVPGHGDTAQNRVALGVDPRDPDPRGDQHDDHQPGRQKHRPEPSAPRRSPLVPGSAPGRAGGLAIIATRAHRTSGA